MKNFLFKVFVCSEKRQLVGALSKQRRLQIFFQVFLTLLGLLYQLVRSFILDFNSGLTEKI